MSRGRDRSGARFELLATALLFSTSGAAIKAVSFGSWQVAGLRSGFAALTLWALLPGARRGWSPATALVALAYAGTLVTFVAAAKLTTAANTIFIQSASPLYILLLSPWLLGERLRPRDIWFLVIQAVGVGVFFLGREAPQLTAPAPIRGNLFAAASGVCWGLTVIGMRWLGRRAEGRDRAAGAAVAGNVLVFALALVGAFPFIPGAPADWVIVSGLGVFQIAGAYVLFTRAIPHVPALEASLLMLIEAPLNATWARLVHGETPSSWAVGGGILILGATLTRAILGERRALP